MIRALGALFAVGLLSLGSDVLACGGHDETAAFQSIDVPKLVTMLSDSKSVVVVDANSDEVRGKYGVIPGARLLSDYAKFDTTRELPEAKTAALVFYCGGPKCGAAPKAAERAAAAGYTNVYVLTDGITGWVTAGEPTVRPNRNS